MSNRQARSNSIPIPRGTPSTSPTRNIESVISIPISIPPRSQAFPLRSSIGTSHIADHHRGPLSYGRDSSSASSPLRIRPTSRSYTPSSGMLPRSTPRTPFTFEPRVVRADSRSITADNACVPSTTPPTATPRARRPSAASNRTSSTYLHAAAHTSAAPATPPSPTISFPRPAYLEHSALRHMLQTESPSSLPPYRRPSEASGSNAVLNISGGRAASPPMDSDDESNSNATPPREITPTFTPSVSSNDNPEAPIPRLPTRWSEQFRHPLLSVSADGRELAYHGPPSVGDKDAAAARTNHPIPPACGIYYYEVEIVHRVKGYISIGFAGNDVRLSRLPGWEKNSWGYHGDDGCSFAAERSGSPYGPTFGTGDIIGCGIDFSQNKAFYTKNGTFLGHVFDNVGKDQPISPSVGLRHTGENIRVNFGQDPFKFDIEFHVQQQRNVTWSTIMETPLNRRLLRSGEDDVDGENEQEPMTEEDTKGPINQLVLGYLAHHGYAKTARTLQKQSETRGLKSRSEDAIMTSVHDTDIDMDDHLDRGLSTPAFEGDIEVRTNIVNSVIKGDIDTAIEATTRYFPSVLEAEEGLMLFKLKCRKFVELILEAAEVNKRMILERAAESDGKDVEGDEIADGMDVDDDAAGPIRDTNGTGSGISASVSRNKRKFSVSPGRASASPAILHPMAAHYENLLNQAIGYGQVLQTKIDSRPEVSTLIKRTFGILAWEDPLGAGGDAAEVAGHEARVALANELNQAILKSQGRPAQPALETLYRQTAACLTKLALMGVGAAAFADMHKEFLDA